MGPSYHLVYMIGGAEAVLNAWNHVIINKKSQKKTLAIKILYMVLWCTFALTLLVEACYIIKPHINVLVSKKDIGPVFGRALA